MQQQQLTLDINSEVSIEGSFRMPNGTQTFVNFDGVCTRFTDQMIEFSQKIQYIDGEMTIPELAPVVAIPIQALSTIQVFELLAPGTIAARIREFEESLVADVSPQDIAAAQITGDTSFDNIINSLDNIIRHHLPQQRVQAVEEAPAEVQTQAADTPAEVQTQAADTPAEVQTQAADTPAEVQTQDAETQAEVQTQAADTPAADTIGVPTPVREITTSMFQHIVETSTDENLNDNNLSNYLAIPNNQVTREVIETLFSTGFTEVVSKYIQNAVDEHGHKVVVDLNLTILIKTLSDKVELLSSTSNIELQPEKAYVISNDNVTLTAVYITWPYFYVVHSSDTETYPEENLVKFNHFDDCNVIESDVEMDMATVFENTTINWEELKNGGLQTTTRTCKRITSDIPTEDLLLELNPNWYSVMKYIQYIANQEGFEHPLLEAIAKAVLKIEEAAQILTQQQEFQDESITG